MEGLQEREPAETRCFLERSRGGAPPPSMLMQLGSGGALCCYGSRIAAGS
uniref:Uncharacterized protein n=1 Tax=Zea mays TaxID=4577 RepID=C4IY80_MAIZE|nr:unknown [Zea mays]